VAPTPLPNATWVHQDCWLNIVSINNTEIEYTLNLETNGVYVMVIEGEIIVDGHTLNSRDAIGIWDTKVVKIEAENARILLIEVPM
jgi:quercetin 2,3-dioxygenase